MPIHLFNPPAPGPEPAWSAGPIGAGYQFAGKCGNCRCIPRYWKLNVTMGANPDDIPGDVGPAPVVASVSSVAAGAGASIVTTAPAGVVVGSRLDLRVGCGQATITTPAGWTPVATAVDTFTNTRMQAFTRVADGTAADTPTVGLSAAVQYRAWIMRITGANPADPIDVFNTGSALSTTNYPVPIVTTTGDNRLAVASVVVTQGSWSTSTPSTWDTVATQAGPIVFSAAIASKQVATAGSVGGQNWVTGGPGAAGSMVTIAYKPEESPPVLGPDLAKYSGEWILERELCYGEAAGGVACIWTAREIDVNQILAEVDDIGQKFASPWILVFNFYDDPAISPVHGWWLNKWTLHCGAFTKSYVPGGLGHFPGISVYQPSLSPWQGLAAYLHDGWDLNKPFRCLRPNRFEIVDCVYPASFPTALTLEPYWP